MQVFRYKARNTLYVWLAVVSFLNILSLIHQSFFPSKPIVSNAWLYYYIISVSTLPYAVMLLYSLSHLLERIVVAHDEVIFTRLFARHIGYSEIAEIRASEKTDIGIDIVRRDGKSVITSCVRIREPEEDILTYRRAVSALLERAGRAKQGIVIRKRARQVADPASELALSQAVKRDGIQSALKGLGGWLLFLTLMLFLDVVTGFLMIPSTGFKPYMVHFVPWVQYTIVGVLISGAIIVFIQLMMKKAIFRKTYVIYLGIYNASLFAFLLAGALTGDSLYVKTTGIILRLAVYIAEVLAWRAYLRLSVRVKNTLVK